MDIKNIHSLLAPWTGHICAEHILQLNFEEIGCFKLLLSKLLSLAVLAGSVLVKLPQVLKL